MNGKRLQRKKEDNIKKIEEKKDERNFNFNEKEKLILSKINNLAGSVTTINQNINGINSDNNNIISELKGQHEVIKKIDVIFNEQIKLINQKIDVILKIVLDEDLTSEDLELIGLESGEEEKKEDIKETSKDVNGKTSAKAKEEPEKVKVKNDGKGSTKSKNK
jgi:hypothetical protein